MLPVFEPEVVAARAVRGGDARQRLSAIRLVEWRNIDVVNDGPVDETYRILDALNDIEDRHREGMYWVSWEGRAGHYLLMLNRNAKHEALW